jgi:hypothetical protein
VSRQWGKLKEVTCAFWEFIEWKRLHTWDSNLDQLIQDDSKDDNGEVSTSPGMCYSCVCRMGKKLHQFMAAKKVLYGTKFL